MTLKNRLFDHFSLFWKKYLFSLIIGLFIFGLSLLSKQSVNLYNVVDGFFFGGLTLIFVGGLSIVTYLGAFDMFSYAFSKKDVKKEGYYNYSINGKEKRAKNKFNFIPYFIIGAFFLIVAFVLRLFI